MTCSSTLQQKFTLRWWLSDRCDMDLTVCILILADVLSPCWFVNYNCVCVYYACLGLCLGTLCSSHPVFRWEVAVCLSERLYIFLHNLQCQVVYTRLHMCTVYCIHKSVPPCVCVCTRMVMCVCVCVHVCIKFGLGQLQLCQSELLQMPELPEEEEKAEEGEHWTQSETNVGGWGGGGQTYGVKKALSGVTCPSAKSLFVFFLPKIDRWAVSAFLKSTLNDATPAQPLQDRPHRFHLDAPQQRAFSGGLVSICNLHAAVCPPLIPLPALDSLFSLFPRHQLWQDETVVVCLPVYTCCADLLLLYSRHRQADRWQPHWHQKRTTKLHRFFRLNSTNVPGRMAPNSD